MAQGRFARAVGLDVAFKMKEMYEERHPTSGGRVWTIVAIAERFGVSESSARRAIHGVGAYRGVPDAVTPELIRESGERLLLLQKLADEIKVTKENEPDAMLERMDAAPLAPKEIEAWLRQPLDMEEVKRKLAEEAKLKGEQNESARADSGRDANGVGADGPVRSALDMRRHVDEGGAREDLEGKKGAAD